MYSAPLRRRPRCDRLPTTVDPVVGAAGAAALGAVLACWLPAASQEGEVASEALGWALLAAVAGSGKRWGFSGTAGQEEVEAEGSLGATTAARGAIGWHVWMVAAGVAGVCCYRAEVDWLWLFVRMRGADGRRAGRVLTGLPADADPAAAARRQEAPA